MGCACELHGLKQGKGHFPTGKIQTADTEGAWSTAKSTAGKGSSTGRKDGGAGEGGHGQAQLLLCTDYFLKNISMDMIHHYTHKKMRKNNFLFKCNYQAEISEIQRKWRQSLENISR